MKGLGFEGLYIVTNFGDAYAQCLCTCLMVALVAPLLGGKSGRDLSKFPWTLKGTSVRSKPNIGGEAPTRDNNPKKYNRKAHLGEGIRINTKLFPEGKVLGAGEGGKIGTPRHQLERACCQPHPLCYQWPRDLMVVEVWFRTNVRR